MGAVQGPNLAYVTIADRGPDHDVEFVVHAFGPDATELAQVVADQLAVWGQQIRGGAGPTFCAYPIGTPDEELPSVSVVDKTYFRITISWPHTA
jgi:protein-L-isoaspartate(D-aspartate) O-methyltransferase